MRARCDGGVGLPRIGQDDVSVFDLAEDILLDDAIGHDDLVTDVVIDEAAEVVFGLL